MGDYKKNSLCFPSPHPHCGGLRQRRISLWVNPSPTRGEGKLLFKALCALSPCGRGQPQFVGLRQVRGILAINISPLRGSLLLRRIFNFPLLPSRRPGALPVQGGVQGVPAERCAFDARRKFLHAFECFQRAECIGVCTAVYAVHHRPEIRKNRLRLLDRLSFHRCRHHRTRRFRYRAAGAGETHVFDDLIFKEDIEHDMIAAERVVAFLLAGGRGNRAKIFRRLVMVEYDLLIEIRQFRHYPSNSFTRSNAAASASISSIVL